MSEYELNYLINEISNVTGWLFDAWMTGTFAVLVTAFLTSDRINEKFFKIMAALYALFCVLMITSFIFRSQQIMYYIYVMQEKGFDVSHHMGAMGVANALMTIGMYILGTVFTLYFIKYNLKSAK